METVRLYIADTDERFVARVRGVIARHRWIEIVGDSGTGRQTLNEVIRLAPDVMLTDITLPEMDGIALLREARRLRQAPSVIVCTKFCSDACVRCACKYGAAFFLCKPIDPQTLPELIVECGRRTADALSSSRERDGSAGQQLRAGIVRDLLKELGMSSRLAGSAYILEAVARCGESDLLLRNLTHGLYAELAARMDTSISRIERALRSAISIAYERGTLSRHFPRKPTNKQFIEFILREVAAVEQARESVNE